MLSHPAAQAQAALTDENLSANLLQGDLESLAGMMKHHQSSTGVGADSITSQEVMI